MIRVAIVEDNRVLYEGHMQVLISGQPDMLLAFHGRIALRLLKRYINQALMLLSWIYDLPKVSGIEGVRLIRENLPSAAIFVLTVF